MEQEYLPNFLKAEAEARESKIDDEATLRHRQAIAMRWFCYYKKSKEQRRREEILRQYNKIATMKQR